MLEPSLKPHCATVHILSGIKLASSNMYQEVEVRACWPAKLCALPSLQVWATIFQVFGRSLWWMTRD